MFEKPVEILGVSESWLDEVEAFLKGATKTTIGARKALQSLRHGQNAITFAKRKINESEAAK